MAKVNKDTLSAYFETGDFPTQEEFKSTIDSCLGVLESTTELPAAGPSNLGNEYKIGNVFYKCVLDSGSYRWAQQATTTPSNDYNDLDNKPKIGGFTLSGDVDVSDIGAVPADDSGIEAVSSLNGNETCYVIVNGALKKTTVSVIRRPTVLKITVPSSGWTFNGNLYTNAVSVQGVTEDSVVYCVPSPSSMQSYLQKPFWCASIASGQLLFACEGTPAMDLSVEVEIR